MKQIRRNIRKPAKAVARRYRQVWLWWRRQDKRYGLWWRAGNALLAAVILAGIVIPVAQQIFTVDSYKLSADTLKLVGSTDQTLAKQLTYDAQSQTYEFNQAAVQGAGSQGGAAGVAGALAAMKAQVGTASGKGSDKSLYALDVPQDFTKGVTYTDANTGLSFSLVPQFSARQGQLSQGHLVFPAGGGTQAIYTLKNNGLKEDIVVQKATKDTMTFGYTLKLPSTLQAKVIPGSDGNIGIYSADPSLYGNISYGDTADQASVQRARVNSPKNNLLFGLPAPVIKNTAGLAVGSARFALSGNTLQVVASGLSGVKTPITIDPSVVVTAASDFATGNNEDNIDFSTSGQITRGGLTGGSIGSWAATTSLNQAASSTGTVAYNGYMYLVSGNVNNPPSNGSDSVQFAPINSNGTVGTWHYTHNSTDDGTTYVAGFGQVEWQFGVVAYNGYLYVIGGTQGSTIYSTAYYAPINSNGTVGTWQTTSSMTTVRYGFSLEAYQGYLYAYGGCKALSAGVCTSPLSSVEYAPINANGTLGSWTASGNSMTTTRLDVTGAVYNGYLYALGGCVSIVLGNCSTTLASVEYAPINSDSTVGTWQTTTSFTTARRQANAVAYGGYMYLMGGTGYLNTTQYAPMYANGALGAWTSTTSFTTGRTNLSAIANNGYLYVIGGCTTGICASGELGDVQYAKINSVGMLGNNGNNGVGQYSTIAKGYDNKTLGGTGVFGQCAVSANGYLYVIGGDPNANNVGSATIRYAQVSADGTVGTWATTTKSLLTNRELMGCTTYGGYLYVAGGETSSTGITYYNTVEYAPLASNGDITTTFQTSTAFTTAGGANGRSELQSVAYNGYLYILGGRFNNNSTLSQDIQYMQIGANGALTGSWAATTAQMPDNNSTHPVGGRAQFGAVVYAGRMYIVGGTSTYGTSLSDVYVGTIGSNGDIASFTLSTLLATPRLDFGIAVSKGFLYVFGGAPQATGGAPLADTQYAQIDPSTGLITGGWHTTVSSTGNTGALWPSLTSASNGFMYALGGCTSMTVLSVQNANNTQCDATADQYNTVQYAPLNNGGPGTAGSWATNSTSYTTDRMYANTIAYNGYLYVLGGQDFSYNKFNDVQYAPINANGTIGTWQTTASFITARSNFGAVAYNGYLYVLGGVSGSGDLNDVQYAPINANGTVGAWHYTHNSTDDSTTFVAGFTNTRSYFSAAAYNGYLYVIGGDGSGTIQYAPMNTSGTVGTWQATTSLPSVNSDFSAVVYNGYLYVIGGNVTGSSINAVSYAPLNTNGTVGTWQATTSLPIPRNYSGAVAYNGYIYVTGGYNNGSYLSDVQYASINANGTIGTWQATTSLPSTMMGMGDAVYGGYLYVMGGVGGSSAPQYSPLNSIPHLAHYSKLIDLGSAVSVTGVTFNGTTGGAVSVSYRAAGATGVFGTSAPVSNIIGTQCTSNLASTRYLLVRVTLDDSYGQGTGGGFPDSAGTAANLTDLTVNYSTGHPPPNIRLRGGQTLQAGTLSSLDTCS